MPARERVTRRRIADLTGSRSLAPSTRAALAALGYDLVPQPVAREAADVDVHLLDESSLHRVPTPEEASDLRIVFISAARGSDPADPRIRGQVHRPAALGDLYPLFQHALESHPRNVPRVSVELPARCIRADHRWPGAMISLSEGGCLLRSSEPIDAGAWLNFQFALPGTPEGELITTRARCVYGDGSSAGLAFSEPSEVDRHAIRGFVSERLAQR